MIKTKKTTTDTRNTYMYFVNNNKTHIHT